MEFCNKDEASKAKLVAEKKLSKKDFAGAKKFSLKAQALYPPGAEEEGLSQLMLTINVYLSAEKKVSREVDWYGVLGVIPTADDETVRKQYRKLALMIHPDKNKCSRADGAFQLVSEAWSLLSDKAKRYAYDQRRGSFHNNNILTNTKSSSSCLNVRPPPTINATNVPPRARNDTFLTKCPTCGTSYEYLTIYVDSLNTCTHCQKRFRALWIDLKMDDSCGISYEPPRWKRSASGYLLYGIYTLRSSSSSGSQVPPPPLRPCANVLNPHSKVAAAPNTAGGGLGGVGANDAPPPHVSNVAQQQQKANNNKRMKRARKDEAAT